MGRVSYGRFTLQGLFSFDAYRLRVPQTDGKVREGACRNEVTYILFVQHLSTVPLLYDGHLFIERLFLIPSLVFISHPSSLKHHLWLDTNDHYQTLY